MKGEGFKPGEWKNNKGDIFIQENRYSVSLYFTLLSICPFLFIGIVFGVLSGCAGKSKQAKASHESVSEKKIIAELPKIGESVTTERALELCVHYGFNHLAERIEDNQELFKEWKFDGCSMTPDAIISELIKVPSLTEICLRHDLGYAYGDPGNEKERIKVDRKFQNELLSAGASEFAAKAMFDAVRVGGKEELCLSFSWGFARVEPCKLGFGLKLKE
ncbi:MAG: hypothetical protein ACYS0I_19375 [Planctomycetota bacterium]